MKPGPVPARRVTIAPLLRVAVRSAAAEGRSIARLSARAGFPNPNHLSVQLHAESFPATPLNMARWRQLALALHYHGEIFVEVAAA